MGETCSACNQATQEIQQINIQEEDNHQSDSPPPQTVKSHTHSKKSPSSHIISSQKETPAEMEQSRRGQKKHSVTIMTSKFNPTRMYQKFSEKAVKLEQMPDYSNEIIKLKKQQFGVFVYDHPKLQIEDVEEFGPIEFENKYIYKGEWKNNQRNGRGVQQWKDGSIYQGYWQNNIAHGYGRLIHADGDVYVGQWLNDRAFGKGTYHSACGAKYEGDWKDDKQHGYGEETWPDEAVYKGQYKNGKKHGKGKFLWEDDSCYEGDFLQNNIHGIGKYVWNNGRVYEGEWRDNKMQGKGVFTWLDGRRYQGQYQNDKKEGFGIFTFRDGRVYEGEWKNGKQHGHGIFKKKNFHREGIWEDGERVKWVQQSKENDQGSRGKESEDCNH